MPTAPRRISESGLYHVVARGNGKQLIFTDDADREMFCSHLSRFASEDGLSVIAWCLMDNHVHLVLQDDSRRLAYAVGSLLGAYAKYFNRITGHVGSVFQPRFFSEPIEDDEYLLASVRYVHINPEKAGICPASEYRWSSYREYAEGDGDGLCATGLVLGMLDGSKGFVELCAGASPRDVGFEGVVKLGSDEALKIADDIARAFDCADASAVKALPISQRNAVVAEMRGNGLTIKQVERVTGLGSGVIARVKICSM